MIAWDPETGRFTRVEGPDGFTTWQEAEEASRFLSGANRRRNPPDRASLHVARAGESEDASDTV